MGFRRPLQEARVLGGDEPLRHEQEEPAGAEQDRSREREPGAAVIHHPGEAPLVQSQAALVDAFRDLVKPPMLHATRRTQEAAAQHRRQGQRYETGDEDRDADRHGEFVEQAANNATHEEHRDEHGRQRQGHRNDGEADLARAVERGLEPRFAHLHMTDDVLQHHDGVVHDEPHAQRQGHQRQVVQAVAQQVHHGEGAHD